MAEALLGLAPAGNLQPLTNKFPISQIEHLQEQLRRVLESKVTSTRAEHISVTFDIRPTVQFTITEHSNGAPGGVDPSLGGEGGTTSQAIVKTIRVNDTIMNQPQDNPTLQSSVAKHIVEMLTEVDNSTWAIRDVSRGNQGWTFAYACQDSVAHWAEQHAKMGSKAIVGEYSQAESDPVLSARPAFDCRGFVSIAFSKSSRTIRVKYDHTPFHRTVAEVAEHFRPPPRRPITPPPEKPKKTPKKRKSELAGGVDRGEGAEGGEGGEAAEQGASAKPKKAPRKRKSDSTGEDGAESSAPRPKKRKKKSDAMPNGDQPPTANGEGGADAADASQGQVTGDQSAVLNVPPAEAARRRETAIRLLSENNVDPETLSTEQFSIFSNQSPDLQRESLAMLVKYGAERLRIVHPKDASASSPSGSPNSQLPGSDTTGQQAEQGDSQSGKKAPKPKLSRGSCTPCRSQRLKCDRGKPTCSTCQESGTDCHYPLEKSRASKGNEESTQPKPKPKKSRKSKKSDEFVDPDLNSGQEDDNAEDHETGRGQQVDAAGEPDLEEDTEPEELESIDYSASMPAQNLISADANPSGQDYFNSGPGSVAFSQGMAGNVKANGGGVSPVLGFADSDAVAQTHEGAFPQHQNAAHQIHRASTPGRHNLPSARHAASASETSGSLPTHPATVQETYLDNTGQLRNTQSSGTTQIPGTAQQHHTQHQPQHHHQQQQHQGSQSAAAAAFDSGLRDTGTVATSHVTIQNQPQQHLASVKPDRVAAPSQISPFQSPSQAVARPMSGTGHRNRTPLSDARTPTPTQSQGQLHQHPHQQISHVTPAATQASASPYGQTPNVSTQSTYNSFSARQSTPANDRPSTGTGRLSYEPYAAQNSPNKAAGNYASQQVPYGSRSSSGSVARDHSASHSGSHPSSSHHMANTQSYSAHSSTPAITAFSQSSATNSGQQYSSVSSYNTRGTTPSTHQSRNSGSYGNYPAQQAQPQQSTQQPSSNQQQGWYGGAAYGSGSGSTSFASGSNNVSGYGGRSGTNSYQPQSTHGSMHLSGQNTYGGGEGDIYELLKAGMHSR